MQKIIEWGLVLAVFCAVNLAGNALGSPDAAWDGAAGGMLILLAVALAGMVLAEVLPFRLPSIAYITLIGVLISLPQMPGSAEVVRLTGQISLLSITTPILAYAGVSIGRNLADFRRLGWRALLVAVLVFVGTYLGSAVVAEAVLRWQGLV
ncbi:hypothetical protein V6667_09865 [Neisseria leonii]|uniref:DUF340 domain-containing protein n=1 Tax=Neisseria leonii TaxID=2995413 RepID=A0A9X4E267_9NEIS|nr:MULTISPECIES: hypothetical protein [unclassified Neisseria]MDD9326043.1 hypothetical protein [Neisseria sp. 3986]MDD9328190.1 hypothetical protein [Neisseria sp. 51.81]